MSMTLDAREATWATVRMRLRGARLRAYQIFQENGPCTTTEAAQRGPMSILTLRPRVTELCEMGLLECVEVRDGNGIYRALDEEFARALLEKRQAGKTEQRELGI
jgi:hypothetical protein